jgi:hypothetical protein
VLKWLLAVVIALLLFGGLTPWLRRMGLGRLPGDISFERDGRRYEFPLGSTILLSLLATLLFHMLK